MGRERVHPVARARGRTNAHTHSQETQLPQHARAATRNESRAPSRTPAPSASPRPRGPRAPETRIRAKREWAYAFAEHGACPPRARTHVQRAHGSLHRRPAAAAAAATTTTTGDERAAADVIIVVVVVVTRICIRHIHTANGARTRECTSPCGRPHSHNTTRATGRAHTGMHITMRPHRPPLHAPRRLAACHPGLRRRRRRGSCASDHQNVKNGIKPNVPNHAHTQTNHCTQNPIKSQKKKSKSNPTQSHTPTQSNSHTESNQNHAHTIQSNRTDQIPNKFTHTESIQITHNRFESNCKPNSSQTSYRMTPVRRLRTERNTTKTHTQQCKRTTDHVQ